MEHLKGQLSKGFARALGVPVDDAIRRYVEAGTGSLPGRASLLRWDVNSVHEFVFATTNPTVVRGASETLKGINATLGRGGMIEAAPEQGEHVIQEVQNLDEPVEQGPARANCLCSFRQDPGLVRGPERGRGDR